MSDLPEPERLARLRKTCGDLHLEPGTYDEAAHAAFMEASPSLRGRAERKAAMARLLVSLIRNGIAPKGRRASCPSGSPMKRRLTAVKGVDPINSAPALVPGYKGKAASAEVSAEAWRFFPTASKKANGERPLRQAWKDTRDVARRRGWAWPTRVQGGICRARAGKLAFPDRGADAGGGCRGGNPPRDRAAQPRAGAAQGRSHDQVFRDGLAARVTRKATARQLYLSGLIYSPVAVDRWGRVQKNGWTYPRAPALIAPYVDILGSALAVHFLLTFGGADLYMAAHPTERARVVQLVGVDLARALGAAELPRRVPLAKPWLAACLAHEGCPVADIARTLHASDTAVRSWLKRAPYRPSPARWGDA
ncbi:DNA-binding domain-containing protein [Rhodovulum steppense]|uniref:DNA-binding domain-containing protein n=1 Tax=Rhodovulum steppense TaxID=540251 RepID=UPI001FB4F537|nr:DNA-binding domain-containing protein [Rhodovulum steppense]